MWEVDPEATKKLIEALWCAHVVDWSNLDFDRIGSLTSDLEEPWNHKYVGGPVFFEGKGGLANLLTGSSLVQAGITLHRLAGEEQALIWSKRLIKRFVDTRHPKTNIGALIYNQSWMLLGEDMASHFDDPYTSMFPWNPYEFKYLYYPENAQSHPWISVIQAGRMIDDKGMELVRWGVEELSAWGKVSYRKEDNSFVPILTDGTCLEGYIWRDVPGNGSGANVIKPCPADSTFFWAYCVAYNATGDEFLWQMARDIGIGSGLGDIGQTPSSKITLRTDTDSSAVYELLGFLELYSKTKNKSYLIVAQRIGNNILEHQFYRGFFVLSKKHVYTRFDCFEPIALLHLVAATARRPVSPPQIWPSIPLFVPPYRFKQEGVDRRVIYSLTDSERPPLSLQEAASIGDIALVRSILRKEVGVDSWDDSLRKTALQRAAISGHKDIVKLLIAHGAEVNRGSTTALHYAAQYGRTEIVELLKKHGAKE
jgi:pectate lyase